jgi:hypothetical protein
LYALPPPQCAMDHRIKKFCLFSFLDILRTKTKSSVFEKQQIHTYTFLKLILFARTYFGTTVYWKNSSTAR